MKPSTLSQAEIDALFAAATGGDIPAEALATPAAQPVPAEPAPAQPAPVQSAPAQPVPAAPAPAQAAIFPNFQPRATGPAQEQVPLGLLANVEMEVTVLLGQVRRSIRDILNMGPGAVIELDRMAGEAVDVLVNNRLVARGEIVVIGENFGVRITELIKETGAPGV